MEYLCQKLHRICATCRKHFPHSSLIAGFVTRVTRRVPLVEQELLTRPEHLGSPMDSSGVRITRSLVLCVCFVVRCLSFCSSLFVLLFVFFWPLCCLFFFDIRNMITPLVSSNLQTLRTQCWSPISTKRTITSHFHLLNTNKTYTCVLNLP